MYTFGNEMAAARQQQFHAEAEQARQVKEARNAENASRVETKVARPRRARLRLGIALRLRSA